MRLVEYEKDLKRMIEEDIENPQIYIAIYELAYRWLLREKHMYDRQKVADIACMIAEDLYIKLTKGVVITSWIGYIKKLFIPYWMQWQKEHIKDQILEIPDFSFELALVGMYAGSTLYDDRLAAILNRDIIKSIPKMVVGILDESRYFKDTSEYLNAQVSILLSLRLGTYVSFKQTEANSKYTRLLYRVLLNRISIELAPSTDDSINHAIAFHQVETSNYLQDRGELWQIF